MSLWKDAPPVSRGLPVNPPERNIRHQFKGKNTEAGPSQGMATPGNPRTPHRAGGAGSGVAAASPARGPAAPVPGFTRESRGVHPHAAPFRGVPSGFGHVRKTLPCHRPSHKSREVSVLCSCDAFQAVNTACPPGGRDTAHPGGRGRIDAQVVGAGVLWRRPHLTACMWVEMHWTPEQGCEPELCDRQPTTPCPSPNPPPTRPRHLTRRRRVPAPTPRRFAHTRV